MSAIPLLSTLLFVAVMFARGDLGPLWYSAAIKTLNAPTTQALGEPGDRAMLQGTVVGACPGPPERGCQGQGIPEAPIAIYRQDNMLVSTLLTLTDGSFQVELAPGCYIVEDITSGQRQTVKLIQGQKTTVELDVPR